MGLSVTVYKNIKETTNPEEADFKAYVIDEAWDWKIRNLKKDAYYTGTPIARTISYPYSTHNRFREELIKLMDRYDLIKGDGTIKWDLIPTDLPFEPFINFADNEGVLDFEVSELLYDNFKRFEKLAEEKLAERYLEYYKEWLRTFKLAKNNGVVVFN